METKTPLTTAFAEKVATDKTFMNRDKTTNYLDAFSAALDEMEKLELALSAARRDAERYRWLRSNCQYGFEDREGPQLIHRNGESGPHQNPGWREELDAAIDAALSAKEKS